VVFTWDDYVFFFECKNRSIPGNSPITVHYFNHTIQSHLKQVRRLRKGLDDHPDILSDRLPDAVGKKRVFCVLNALPYASPPVDGIYFSDQGLILRFFDSASIGFNRVPLNKDSAAPATRLELARLWKGEVPTAEDFVQYLGDPPQLKIAGAHYRAEVRAELLSKTVVTKIIDLQRKVVEVEGIAAMLREHAAVPATRPQEGPGTQSNPE